jgi:hypothetical protein
MRFALPRLLSAFSTVAIAVSAFAQADVTSPGDPITGTSGNTPGAETVDKAIDNNTNTKYLNFDKLNTGFTVTPASGLSVVTGIALTSANDAPERDPSSVTIEGSTDGSSFTLIASNTVAPFGNRFERQVVQFANSAAYTSYRVIFPTVRDAGAANSMQIAEVELLGNIYTPGPAVVAQPPQSQTNFVGQTATFSVVANGTPPFTYQWYSNDVAISAATAASYTTPALTLSANGAVYTVALSNSLDGQISGGATLTVREAPGVQTASSRGYSSTVFVTFVKPVVLNSGTYTLSNSAGTIAISGRAYGSSQSEIVLSLESGLAVNGFYTLVVSDVQAQDASALAASAVTFQHGFGGFCANFDSGLPAGAFLFGSATNGLDGILHLTDDGVAGACGTLYISNQTGGAMLDRLQARWKSRIGGAASGNADGYSLNWYQGAPLNCGNFTAEEGNPTGLSFTIDTYDGGAGPDTGIEIKWRGTRLAFQHIPRNGSGSANYLTKDVFVDVEASIDPSGRASFTYDGNTIRAMVTNWSGITNGAFLFAARTGGETDNHWIDDLCINNFTLGAATVAESPTNLTVLENLPATFSVRPDGTFPYTYAWYTNGVLVAGATNSTFTIPSAVAGLDGAQITAVVANSQGAATSSVATLTVDQRVRLLSARAVSSNVVAVTFSRAVDLNSGSYNFPGGNVDENIRSYGSSQSEVLIELGTPLTLDTPYIVEVQDVVSAVGDFPQLVSPAYASFFYGYGRLCTDFNSGLPAQAALFGTATLAGDGSVHLTEAQGSQNGTLIISGLNSTNLLDRFTVRYRMRVGGGTATPADGYSFNVASDLPNGTIGGGEEGHNTGLVLAFDNYNNGAGESPGANQAPSIAIKWNGAFLTNYLTTLFRSGANFFDVVVNMEPDGTLDLIYNGTVVFHNFPTPFRGIVAPKYGWTARTGGLTDAHWVDDICINNFTPGRAFIVSQPVSVTVLEGETANFSVTADGTFPYRFEWFTNGAAVPGATTATLSLPGTEALNGTQVSVSVSNDFGGTISTVATLTVNLSPRVIGVSTRGSNEVIVNFTRPVVLSSGFYEFPLGPAEEGPRAFGTNQSQIIVQTLAPLQPNTLYELGVLDVVSQAGNLPVLTNPTNVNFIHGGGGACIDFNSALPANAVLSGSSYVSNNVLHLTDDAGTGACGTLYVSNSTFGLNANQLIASFKARVGGPLNGNADGFSFNWASDLPVSGCGTFTAEEGAGSGLSFTVDTFDNGAGPDNGIEIKWRGQRLAFQFIPRNGVGNTNYLTRDKFVNVSVTVDTAGRVTFIYDANVLTATIPNWSGITNAAFLFASRTGGQSDNVWIDDLCLNAYSTGPVIITQQPTNTIVTVNRRATLSVGIDGQPPYSIQWYSNNVAVAGANTATYTTAPLGQAASGAQYQAVVANYSGSVTSSVAVVTVRQDAGPLFTTRSAPNEITINWENPRAVLQATTSLTPPVQWTNVDYDPPFTYSTSSATNLFFRIVEQ